LRSSSRTLTTANRRCRSAAAHRPADIADRTRRQGGRRAVRDRHLRRLGVCTELSFRPVAGPRVTARRRRVCSGGNRGARSLGAPVSISDLRGLMRPPADPPLSPRHLPSSVGSDVSSAQLTSFRRSSC
jgi:hypothetical protein